MSPPHNQNARLTPGVGLGSASRTSCKQLDSQPPAAPQEPSVADFKQRIRDLETIADWRTDLEFRIRHAQLRFEFVGLEPEEQDDLAAEVHIFKRVCFALADSLGRGADD